MEDNVAQAAREIENPDADHSAGPAERDEPYGHIAGIRTSRILWVVYFCYATVVAVLFQKLVVPNLPSLSAGYGLLNGDSQYFHKVAVELAEAIREFGWQQWTPWPALGATGNVALLAALYAIFGTDPSLIIPVNAALHATGGLLIFLIGKKLAPGHLGFYAGLVTSILFVCFPSSLNWYGQIHKDGFAIAGFLLVAYAWIAWTQRPTSWRDCLVLAALSLVGACLIAFVRPYAVTMLAAVNLFAFLAVILYRAAAGEPLRRFASGGFVIWAAVAAIIAFLPPASSSAMADSPRVDCPHIHTWEWQDSEALPNSLERYLRQVAHYRQFFSCAAYDAGSTLDRDVVPDNAADVMSYLPRGLSIALWAPFPTTWFESLSPVRLVGTAETVIWYLIAPGIILAVVRQRSPGLVFAIVSAIGLLTIYGFVISNLGTLHRVRYPFIFLAMLIGMIGWAGVIQQRWRQRSRVDNRISAPVTAALPTKTPDDKTHTAAGAVLSRGGIASAGIAVGIFTAAGYLLLFGRDILMSRIFGLGTELDAFYIGMLVPMFLVNVFSIPIGAALIPLYRERLERHGQKAAGEIVGSTLLAFSLIFSVLAVALVALGPPLLRLVGWGLDEATLAGALTVLPYGSVILFLSVFVVLANSILNSRFDFFTPAVSQLAVPVAAIAALLLFGQAVGAVAVAVGMLVGQAANLLIVWLRMKKEDVVLHATWRHVGESLRPAVPLFIALCGSALFVNAAVMIDNAMASTLQAGSVGAYSLGTKVVSFCTGIVGAGITAVLLPHFSSFFSSGRVAKGRQELRFYLFAGSLFAIPVAVALFLLAETLVRLAFLGGAFDERSAQTVSQVAAFGIIQIPFFTAHALLMKFANAARRSGLVFVTSLVGLLLNIVLNLALMRFVGVAGLALATSLSLWITSLLLLLWTHRHEHIHIVDIILLSLVWLLYLTLLLCLHYGSYSGVAVSMLALLVLFAENRHLIFRETDKIVALPRLSTG